jgi:hypothetical protein
MLSIKLAESVGKGHLSYSSIKYALQDMKLWEMYMRGQLKKESDALTFGSMYDCLLFTPEDFDKQFYILNDSDIIEQLMQERPNLTSPRMTSKYKAWLKEYAEETAEKGLKMVSQEDADTAKEMIERLKVSGVLENYLIGDYQHEFNQEIEGVPVRGFLDCLNKEYISDHKTTRSLSSFRYAVKDYGYDIQAYIYCTVLGLDKFYWVAQEKAYPYAIGVFEASEETLKRGKEKFDTAVDRINTYLDNNIQTDTFYIKATI